MTLLRRLRNGLYYKFDESSYSQQPEVTACQGGGETIRGHYSIENLLREQSGDVVCGNITRNPPADLLYSHHDPEQRGENKGLSHVCSLSLRSGSHTYQDTSFAEMPDKIKDKEETSCYTKQNVSPLFFPPYPLFIGSYHPGIIGDEE